MWQALCTSVLLLAGLCPSARTDDSLHSAVKALHSKQRDMSSLYQNPYLIGNGQPEDIGYGFQKNIVPNSAGVFETGPLPDSQLGTYDATDPDALEKLVLDYLRQEHQARRYGAWYGDSKRSVFRENSAYPLEAVQALWSRQERDDGGSAFRERNGNGRWRLRKSHALVRNYGGHGEEDETTAQEDALDLLNSIWERYRGEEGGEPELQGPEYGYQAVAAGGERDKRKPAAGGHQYGWGGYYDSPDWSPYGWAKRDDLTRDEDAGRMLFSPRYRALDKRYPIAKRSTDFKKNPSKQTDPKTQKEISDIFSPHKSNSSEKSDTRGALTTAAAPRAPKNESKTVKDDGGQKELSTGNALDRPLDVEKKSIKWSDYLGVDRRKKSYPTTSGDDAWLSDRYMKAAYGGGGGEYWPLYEDKAADDDRPDAAGLGLDMDSKLRAMEDMIVDRAIKYTGAHDPPTDPQQLHHIKYQVMSELAAAYSLEKMRRALEELRSSIRHQGVQVRSHHHPLNGGGGEASKGQSAGLQSAAAAAALPPLDKKSPRVKENSVEADPYEELDRERDCPVMDALIERCSVASAAALDKDGAFLPLCILHQICQQCGDGENCDATFLRESGRSCSGDGPCRLTASRVLDAVRSLRAAEPPLACAHPCLASFLYRRR